MNVLLIAYDNDSYIHWFPHGLAYIAAVLRKAGHHITIYNQDQYHYCQSHLTGFIDCNSFDIVGLGLIAGYYQYRKLLEISSAINAAKKHPFYVLGGSGPSPEPEYFLRKTGAEAIVLGEGEATAVDLLNALEAKRNLSLVKGIAYFRNDKLVITGRRQLIEDVDSIPFPAWDLFPMDYYALIREAHIKNSERSFPVLSGRGCAFSCNFCYRMYKGIRVRSPGSIIKEIEALKDRYNISYINFTDELLMSSSSRTIELCEALIKHKLNIKWSCNGRLNFAVPKVLKAMKRAGCVFIGYGIECLSDAILKNMNKKLTVAQIIAGIEATLAAGISPGFNVIFGNIGENESTLKAGLDFLLKYDDHAQLRTIRPVTPYPGSPLYYYAIKKGLLKDVAEFYEKKHLNSDLLSVNFTGLTDEQFHKCLFGANKKLLENYHQYKLQEQVTELSNLYFNKDVSFRGFRQT